MRDRHERGDGAAGGDGHLAAASAEGDQAQAATGAAAVDLNTLPSDAPFSVAEAVGGEDEQQPGAVMVIRRELKKD